MNSIFRRLRAKLLPRAVDRLWSLASDLAWRYGFYGSAKSLSSTGAGGEAIPWISYPAQEYLRQLDLSRISLLELGSGNSTLFWARRCKKVLAVEHDKNWGAQVQAKLPKNATLLLALERSAYLAPLKKGRYDAIVIDGIHRLDCARLAGKALKKGGWVLLDNSEWHPKSAGALRKSGLIQIDFYGFGPINDYASVSSLFLHPAFRPKTKSRRQPEHGLATRRDINDAG